MRSGQLDALITGKFLHFMHLPLAWHTLQPRRSEDRWETAEVNEPTPEQCEQRPVPSHESQGVNAIRVAYGEAVAELGRR